MAHIDKDREEEKRREGREGRDLTRDGDGDGDGGAVITQLQRAKMWR